MPGLLDAAAALAAPEARIFDDRAVACDNVARCEATALQAPEQFGDMPSQALLPREPGSADAQARARPIRRSRFRMIEARVLGECRGSVKRLTVFRAMPEWR